MKTFASIDFSSLDRPLLVAVRRYSHSGGGSAPPGIATVAPSLYWGIASAPAGAVFNATVAFEYDFFGGVADPTALRLLKRSASGLPWEIVPTTVNGDDRTLVASGVTSFGEWTIGSTDGSNTLVPTSPGVAGSPNPPDSSVGIGRYPLLSWSHAAGAYRYDVHFWPSTGSMPSVPTASDLTGPSYSVAGGLGYDSPYHWRVTAKNLAGSSSSPVWTFIRLAVKPESPLRDTHPRN